MRIVLAGGGTGGHITPLVATAQAIKQQNKAAKLIYIGPRGALEVYPGASALFESQYAITSGKFRRFSDEGPLRAALNLPRQLLNMIDLIKLAIGTFQALYLLRRLKPAAVFTKGGYHSLPVGLAAGVLRRPLITHESDARLGLANRVLARFAAVIAVSFPLKTYPKTLQEKMKMTGNPVRTELQERLPAAAARTAFKLDAQRPVVLVMGGSQGARPINDAVLTHLKQLTAQYQLIHITGSSDYARVARAATGATADNANYRLYEFIGDIGQAYAVADVVIARAGMNTISEIAAQGLAAIVVPAPQLGDQLENARYLEDKRAALITTEAALAQELPDLLVKVTATRQKERLKKGIAKLAAPQAAEKLAKIIVQKARHE